MARHAFLAFACLSAVVGTVYAALHLHLRSKHLAFAQMERDYKIAAGLFRNKKYEKAIKLLIPIAECECIRSAEACSLLWECYRRGLGVMPDAEKCLEYELKKEAAIRRTRPLLHILPFDKIRASEIIR